MKSDVKGRNLGGLCIIKAALGDLLCAHNLSSPVMRHLSVSFSYYCILTCYCKIVLNMQLYVQYVE